MYPLFTSIWKVSENIFPLETEYFCYLGAHAKFQTRTTNPSGRKVTQGERKKKKGKKIVNSGLPGARELLAHALRSNEKIRY